MVVLRVEIGQTSCREFEQNGVRRVRRVDYYRHGNQGYVAATQLCTSTRILARLIISHEGLYFANNGDRNHVYIRLPSLSMSALRRKLVNTILLFRGLSGLFKASIVKGKPRALTKATKRRGSVRGLLLMGVESTFDTRKVVRGILVHGTCTVLGLNFVHPTGIHYLKGVRGLAQYAV